MAANPKTERRSPSGEPLKAETGDGRVLVTSRGLAVALGVSLRTVERMLASGEIKGVRIHKRPVRFYVPDVVEALRNGSRKWGRQAEFQGTQGTERTQGA